jgi:phosphoglycerate kinase
MNKKTIRDIDITSKRVLVRVDFNVPIDKETGEILDDTRIRAAVPTIDYLRERNAKTILVSHLGRPDGKVVESMRLAPVAARLGELLGASVPCATDVVGASAEAAVASLQPGGVVMLENVRFEPGEEKNDPALAKKLASFADVYVNDAFGTAHRAHASTAGIAAHLPAVAGFLMEKKVDLLLVGGGMASTFLKARGVAVGTSLVEDDQLDRAREIVAEAERRVVALGLPVDAVIAERFAEDAAARTVDIDAVPDGWMIMDAGPKTVTAYEAKLSGAKTVVWNGPLGVAEWEAFAQGSRAIARYLAGSGATVVIGGGETVAMVQDLGLADRFAHVSTGGGASLEFLEGRTLPGVAALMDR